MRRARPGHDIGRARRVQASVRHAWTQIQSWTNREVALRTGHNDRRLLRIARTAGALSVFTLVALGLCWAIDRLHGRETPFWTPESFVSLREAPGAPETWTETW